jgi:hypothetical protein
MSGTANNSTNASDVGLIVQGTLIFLSAVVGVLGYVIQSRLSQKEAARQLLIQQKEHGRQLKLKRVRQQIEIFVGPALAYIDAYGRLFARSIMHYFNPGFNFNQLSEEIMGFPMTNWGTMDVCYGQGWMLTKENEKIVLNDPEGEMAKRYRDITRVIIYKYLEPLSKLIMEHGNAQQFRPSMADFKKQFPGLANANRPRHLVLYDMKIWTDEFLYIIESHWDKGDYKILYPKACKLSIATYPYLSTMLENLLKEEKELTVGDFAEHHTREDDDINDSLQKLKNINFTKTTTYATTDKDTKVEIKK